MYLQPLLTGCGINVCCKPLLSLCAHDSAHVLCAAATACACLGVLLQQLVPAVREDVE